MQILGDDGDWTKNDFWTAVKFLRHAFRSNEILQVGKMFEVVQVDKDEKTCTKCVDLKCNSPKDSGCFEASTMTFSSEDQVLLVVKETPVVNASIYVASPGSVTKDANSGSTIIQASTNTPDQFLFHPMSSTLVYY
ncbi:hypothetical protein E1A91_D13G109000v1 [Gossypium mustelinum]|uniref:Uncharacterized protein n=1 Tax=Gossypium mustelinum TaxID=34275 RepID=A0A5D2RZX3_GOSMU|nr:hypothetical protein E1A91_D13G109000v1 [Gossypium mustelinum]